MKLGFLELPSDERRLYIEQAAQRRNPARSVLFRERSGQPRFVATTRQ